MDPQIVVKIEGAEEIKAALERAGDRAARILEGAVRAGAEPIRDEMSRRAPRDRGELAGHIEIEVAAKDRTTVKVEAGPDRDHFYGLILELGAQAHEITPQVKKALRIGGEFAANAEHPGIPAQPFMRPALDSKKDEAEKAIEHEIKRALGL